MHIKEQEITYLVNNDILDKFFFIAMCNSKWQLTLIGLIGVEGLLVYHRLSTTLKDTD